MLLSATFPLNVRIIWSYTFSDGPSFYVACVCNHCHWTSQNRCSMIGLTSNLFFVYNGFNFIAFLFLWLPVWLWWFCVWVIWYVLFFIFLWNSIGRVRWIFYVGLVSSIFSGGCVIGIFSVGCVSGILNVGRIGEVIRLSELIQLSGFIWLSVLIRLSGLIPLVGLIWPSELFSRSK